MGLAKPSVMQSASHKGTTCFFTGEHSHFRSKASRAAYEISLTEIVFDQLDL